jgi:hypothetical protein
MGIFAAIAGKTMASAANGENVPFTWAGLDLV